MSKNYSELNSELDGLLEKVGGERRKSRRIPIDLSELPKTVPAGSVCNVEAVPNPAELKFRDLVVIKESSNYKLRRVLRKQGDGVVLGGDAFGDIAPHYYGGKLLRVLEAFQNGKKLELKTSPDVGLYLSWLRSFLSN